MRYMLLIYMNEQAVNEADRAACYEESARLTHRLRASGQYLESAPLQPTATSTSVRVREGKLLVTDGPFAETREQLGGFYLIDAKNLDEAIGIALQVPMARRGTVEIRPLVELPDVPEPGPLTPAEADRPRR